MEIRRRMMMAAAGAVPQDFTWLQNFVGVSGVFTANAGAVYRFHVIGRGGNGGAGGDSWCSTPDGSTDIDVECDLGKGGGAGASGAYALHEVYMRNGETAQITYSEEKTVLIVGGVTVTALCGGDGTDGTDSSTSGIGGKGREATGANRLNLSGRDGENGEGPRTEDFSAENFSAYCEGGDAKVPAGSSYMGSYSSGSEEKITLGGGGDGGDSEGFSGTQQVNGWMSVHYLDARSGGKGRVGGVVVEIGV